MEQGVYWSMEHKTRLFSEPKMERKQIGLPHVQHKCALHVHAHAHAHAHVHVHVMHMHMYNMCMHMCMCMHMHMRWMLQPYGGGCVVYSM